MVLADGDRWVGIDLESSVFECGCFEKHVLLLVWRLVEEGWEFGACSYFSCFRIGTSERKMPMVSISAHFSFSDSMRY